MSLGLDRSGWRRVRFGDVVNRSRRQVNQSSQLVERYVAGGHFDDGALEVTRFGHPDDGGMGSTFTYAFDPGQVLYVSASWYLRKVGVATFSGVVADKTYVLESSDPLILDQRFLPWVLLSEKLLAYAAAKSTGSMNARLLWGTLSNFEFDLPPLDEQQRIADLMWAVERHRSAMNAVQTATERVHGDARIALLSVGPREDWRRAVWTVDHVDHWTEQLPEGWSVQTIKSVGRVRSGATPNRSEQKRYFDGGETPWVKTLDLNESLILETDEQITPEAIAETSAKVVPAGTVLVAMYGGFGQIGRTARLGVDAATNQAVSAVVNLREEVDPEYLHEVLKAGRAKWRKVAASSRKDPNITKRDVENFDFPLPPRDEQREILAVLGEIQRAIDAVAVEKGALSAFRAGILAEIFGGA